MQDNVLVIYSVDFLPDGPSPGQEASPSSSSANSAAEWGCTAPYESAKTQSEANARGLPLYSSQCRPANAWGKESRGMRLAIIQATGIRSFAAELADSMLDAS